MYDDSDLTNEVWQCKYFLFWAKRQNKPIEDRTANSVFVGWKGSEIYFKNVLLP